MKYLCLVYHDEESEVDHMSESEFAAVEQDVREYIGRLRDRGNHIVAAPLQAPDTAATMRLRNGVLTHVTGTGPAAAGPDVEITLTEADLRALLLGTVAPAGLAARDTVGITGDTGRIAELVGRLGTPDPDFVIVTP